ncbi:MAG: 23S rRNA (uracil(1939)-C(5))-methyltransferase RlmD [Tissierellia bacterium]|nr:23S rRNA (uracil(1939)-C(5))-methyltransferase RlmD [Tissierellia bacterium]
MNYENVKVIDILQDGRGVGKKDDITIFIENAIYGEVVNVKVVNKKKNYLEAVKTQTVIPSDFYRQPPCLFFDKCGGCSIMNIEYEKQLELKRKLLVSQLQKIAGIDVSNINIQSDREFEYRNKITLKVDKIGKLSYFAKNSHDYVYINDCMIASKLIRENLSSIQQLVSKVNSKFESAIKEIVIRSNEKQIFLIINLSKLNDKIKEFIKENIKDLNFVVTLKYNKKEVNLKGDGYILMDYEGYKFRISASSFYQVNNFMLKKLYDSARKYIKKDYKLLDIYCGVGASTISQSNNNIVGVEINKDAVKDANYNAQKNKVKDYKFIAQNSSNIDSKLINKIDPDIITVDPPRKGLESKLVKSIINSNVNKMIYISCNPATLSRDLKKLIDAGFKVENIEAFDMFPQSMNVETVVLLSKLDVDKHIKIEFGEDELSEIEFSKDPTYKEIQEYVLNKFGLKVSNLYIAQVKRKHGLIERENYNVSKKNEEEQVIPQCPPEKEKAIENALEWFGLNV